VLADRIVNRVLSATSEKDASVWDGFSAELRRNDGHPKAIE
jgi:hypothetical protein